MIKSGSELQADIRTLEAINKANIQSVDLDRVCGFYDIVISVRSLNNKYYRYRNGDLKVTTCWYYLNPAEIIFLRLYGVSVISSKPLMFHTEYRVIISDWGV